MSKVAKHRSRGNRRYRRTVLRRGFGDVEHVFPVTTRQMTPAELATFKPVTREKGHRTTSS